MKFRLADRRPGQHLGLHMKRLKPTMIVIAFIGFSMIAYRAQADENLHSSSASGIELNSDGCSTEFFIGPWVRTTASGYQRGDATIDPTAEMAWRSAAASHFDVDFETTATAKDGRMDCRALSKGDARCRMIARPCR